MKEAQFLNNKNKHKFSFWNMFQKLEISYLRKIGSFKENSLKTVFIIKPNYNGFSLLSLIVFVLVSQASYSQKYKIKNLRLQNEMWKVWTIEANAGVLSFYGDLSLEDNSFIEKLKLESGPGISLNLTRHFNRLFSLSGQLLIGGLKGSNYTSSFNADLAEYNLNVRLNIYNLFNPQNKGKFGVTVVAGLGQFLYSSTKISYKEGGNVTTTHSARVPEFVYFIGGGGFYKPKDRFGISMDMGLRQCQNDWLDVLVKNNNYDYYTYWSLGIVYYIDNFIHKKPVKNKARIAHSNAKLKHL